MYKGDWANNREYVKGFSISDIMQLHSSGIVTSRDQFTIDIDKGDLATRISDFVKLDVEDAREKYNLGKDTRDWKVSTAKSDASPFDMSFITPINYRVFDTRWTYYTGVGRGFMTNPRKDVMSHLIGSEENIALAVTKQYKVGNGFSHVLCHKHIADSSVLSTSSSEVASIFPLFLTRSVFDQEQSPESNLDVDIFTRLREISTPSDHSKTSELDVFDYIYGVLHCSKYRLVYRDLLRLDFPRIPWPSSSENFWHVSSNGGKLRLLHLMNPNAVRLGNNEYPFKEEVTNKGSNIVERITYSCQRVWINDIQYFENVNEILWNFPIGGYVPAQKWLKDRIGREMSWRDAIHYRSILKVLSETNRIMESIDIKLPDSV